MLGIFAGSWTAELAAKIPAGVRVVIATDPDGPGETYARRIAATLAGRCELMRLVLPEGLRDLNAAHCAGRLDLAALRPFEVVQAVPPAAPVALMGCAWDRRALELLNRWPNVWEGPPRELARTLLLCAGQRAPQAAVRGLERALVRLHERGTLPERFTLAAAWGPPTGDKGGELAGGVPKNVVEQGEVGREQPENEFEVISGPDFRGEAGLVHRDFKPDNVMTGTSGPDFWGEEGHLDLKSDQGLEGEPEEVDRERAENELEVISGPDFRGEVGLVHRDFKPDNVMTGTSGPDFWDEGHLDLGCDQGLGVEPEVGQERAENEIGVTFGPDFRGATGLEHRDFKPDNGLGTELGTEQDRGQQTSAAGAARRELERNLAEMTRASPEVRARLAALRRGRPKP